MIEPMVQAAAGMRVYPAKVLRRIAELCRRHCVLLIAEEVETGFGRTGRMFACEHAGVTPDILCCAKGLTGGFLPLAATAVTDRVYDAFRGDFLSGRTFCHGHSFTGNPLGCAAAAASLSILIERNIPESLSALIRHFTRRLHETFDDVPWVGDVRSIGMIGALELAADRSSKQPFNAADRVAFRICRHALENGVIVRPLGQVIYFIPPYVITPDEIDRMFETVRRAIETAAGHA